MISFEFCIIILELVLSRRLFRISRQLYSGRSLGRLRALALLLILAGAISHITGDLMLHPSSYELDTIKSLILRFVIVVFNVIGLSMLVVHPVDFTWKVVLNSSFNRWLVILILTFDVFIFLSMFNNLM